MGRPRKLTPTAVKLDRTGSWYCNWTDANGHRYKHRFGCKRDLPRQVDADQVFTQWLANDGPRRHMDHVNGGQTLSTALDTPTVRDLCEHYYTHAATYYRKDYRDGTKATPTVSRVKLACDCLVENLGHRFADSVTRSDIELVRERLIDGPNGTRSARTVNNLLVVVKQLFRHFAGVSIPAEVAYAVDLVKPLQAQRSRAKGTDPVKPIDWSVVETTLDHLPPTIQAMVRVQYLAAMRPGEVCAMRGVDLDTSDESAWIYSYDEHKTAHKTGTPKRIVLGPQAIAVVKDYLTTDHTAYLFTPANALRELGQTPKRNTRAFYDHTTYRHAIHYACDAAFPPPPNLTGDDRSAWRSDHRWSPNQLRHTRATELRESHGAETAQLVLGHSKLSTTEIYAERNLSAAIDLQRQIG